MERKEAIEVIKKNWPDSRFTMLREALETVIPELKESEDERIRKALIEGFKIVKDGSYGECTFSNYNIPVTDIIAWLEKQGEPQPKREWTEENERKLEESISLIKSNNTGTFYYEKDELISFLKSLKNRVQSQLQWRPSDEQMEALLSKLPVIKGSGDKVQGILESLYQDLKKLMSYESKVQRN